MFYIRMMEEKRFKKKRIKSKIKQRKNQAVRDQKIYTLGGEIFSSITHGLTALCCASTLVLSIVLASSRNMGAVAIIAVCIYGATAVLGFTISTVYHALAINSGKRVMRVLDYCSIYFIIAGTYTPFSLIGIGGVIGWIIFGTNWALCALGTTLSAINREKYRKFSFICYLTMGWIIVIAIVPLIKSIGFGWCFWLLVLGGVAYTLGAVIFKLKGKYMHGIWHLFTLIGFVLQFLSVYLLMTK